MSPLPDRAFRLTRRLRSMPAVESHRLDGSRLHVSLAAPAHYRDAALVVPGLGQDASLLSGGPHPLHASDAERLGIALAVVDLSGRGRTPGSDDWGGPTHRQDVRLALDWLAGRADRVVLVSLSFGCAAASGAVHGSPACAWIDWEGPSTRDAITAGGTRLAPAAGHGLDDDSWWAPREATRHVGAAGVGYWRIQSRRDHAQPGRLDHAIAMLEAADAGDLPWLRLNDHAPGVPEDPVWLAPGLHAASSALRRALARLTRPRPPR